MYDDKVGASRPVLLWQGEAPRADAGALAHRRIMSRHRRAMIDDKKTAKAKAIAEARAASKKKIQERRAARLGRARPFVLPASPPAARVIKPLRSWRGRMVEPAPRHMLRWEVQEGVTEAKAHAGAAATALYKNDDSIAHRCTKADALEAYKVAARAVRQCGCTCECRCKVTSACCCGCRCACRAAARQLYRDYCAASYDAVVDQRAVEDLQGSAGSVCAAAAAREQLWHSDTSEHSQTTPEFNQAQSRLYDEAVSQSFKAFGRAVNEFGALLDRNRANREERRLNGYRFKTSRTTRTACTQAAACDEIEIKIELEIDEPVPIEIVAVGVDDADVEAAVVVVDAVNEDDEEDVDAVAPVRAAINFERGQADVAALDVAVAAERDEADHDLEAAEPAGRLQRALGRARRALGGAAAAASAWCGHRAAQLRLLLDLSALRARLPAVAGWRAWSRPP